MAIWYNGPEFHLGADGFNVETAGWRELARQALERQADGHERPRERHEAPVRRGETAQEELVRLQRRYDELEGKIRAAERAAPAAASPPSREYATRSGSRPLAQHSVEFRRWAEGALRARRDGVVWPAWKDVKAGKAKLPI